jgi:hypothetical protein
LMDRMAANFNRKVTVGGRSFANETVILETARKLSRFLTAPKGLLSFAYPFSVGESGHVDTDVAQRVARMTYADARKLGISKAGLWNMKRRAAEGKPLKLYRKVFGRLSPVGGEY